MESPNLLISVTGGTLEMTSRLRDVFRNGLVKAAESTGSLSLHEIHEYIIQTVLTTNIECSVLHTL